MSNERSQAVHKFTNGNFSLFASEVSKNIAKCCYQNVLTLEILGWQGGESLAHSNQCTYELSLSYKPWSLTRDAMD